METEEIQIINAELAEDGDYRFWLDRFEEIEYPDIGDEDPVLVHQ